MIDIRSQSEHQSPSEEAPLLALELERLLGAAQLSRVVGVIGGHDVEFDRLVLVEAH
jgi:hypothetical protein